MRSSWRSLIAVAFAALVFGCSSNEAAPSVQDSGSSPGNDAGLPSGSDASDMPAQDASAGFDTGVVPSADAGLPSSDAAVSGDAGPPVMDQCNPVDQTGCMAPASKCIVENPMPGLGATCVEPGNDVMLGGMCTGGDCEAGLACVRTSSTTSICQKVCDFVGNGAGCEALGNDYECRTRLTGTNWGVCAELPPLCNYLTQDPCSVDQACAPFLRRAGNYEFRCRRAGAQMEGQTCGSSGGGDCARGLVCIRSQMTMQAVCRKYCQINDDCTMPLMCNGMVSDPAFQFCQ